MVFFFLLTCVVAVEREKRSYCRGIEIEQCHVVCDLLVDWTGIIEGGGVIKINMADTLKQFLYISSLSLVSFTRYSVYHN